MSDDFDVEAMLEAPYRKEEEDRVKDDQEYERSSSRSKKKKSKSRSRSKSRNRDKRRDRGDRDKDRDRKKSRERRRSRSRSKSPFKKDYRDRHHDRYDSRRHDRYDSGRFENYRKREERKMSKSPIRISNIAPTPELSPEEKDARTVFCMQLSARIRPRDLEEFFSSVGKVRDVRLITDNKTRRSKGIAYIEFQAADSVPLAIGLSGQKLLGVPIIVQASQAEKNRTAMPTHILPKSAQGPMRLYVGSLHYNITEEMLRGIFSPFGKIDDIKLIKDHESGRSQGYGFVTFPEAEDAKKAYEQLNGFELAGRPMKVGHVTERMAEIQASGGSMLDGEEIDRSGIDLGATGRLQLMAKLAEGTGFQIPQYAANALSQAGVPGAPQMMQSGMSSTVPQANQSAPPIATQCFMLSNMFDPMTETRLNWDQEIRDDVIEECSKHGGVLHIFVDKASPQGNVYVKNPTISAAVASVNALHGRYFAGRIITAAYVPVPNYHALFPESVRANQLIVPSSQALQASYASGFSSGMSQPVL